MYFTIVVTLICASAALSKLVFWLFKPTNLPAGCRPLPGPRGIFISTHFSRSKANRTTGVLPWLGPISQIPRFGAWFKFKAWADQYGPIYHIRLLGKDHIIIASEDVASQLLGSRGAIYSGRPSIPTLYDSQSNHGTAEYLPLMSKNQDHTRQKKFNHVSIAVASRNDYYMYPSIEAKRLVHRMMHSTTAWTTQIEDMTSRVASRLAWGSPNLGEGLRRDAWNLLTHISPAGFLTNVVTPLNALPTWLSPWKKAEQERHNLQKAWFVNNMNDVAKKILAGTAGPSYMRTWLETVTIKGANNKITPSTTLEAAFAVGTLAFTAVYTVSSPMQTFVRAAIQHPSWLAKVQAELDSVIGDARMPEVSDTPHLPVLRAFLAECLRWQPPIPSGIPHQVDRDDVFEGYFIPKGACVHPLEWAFSRDSEKYPEPEAFNPQRWLDPGFPKTYREPLTRYPTIVGGSWFGWGRRYCMGQELTMQEAVVGCGSLAWAFDIKRKETVGEGDGNGKGKGKGNGKAAVDVEIEEKEGMRVPKRWDESLIIAKPPAEEIECVVRSEKRRLVVEAAYKDSKKLGADVLRDLGNVLVE